MKAQKFQATLPPRSATVFVGVDPSLSATGVVTLDDDESPSFDLENDSDNTMSLLARIELMCDFVRYRRDTHVLFVIETPTGGIAGGTGMMLAALGFSIRRDLQGYNVLNVCPTHVKMFATGKGNAKKEEMLKAVYKKWGYDTSDNNLADAYTLAKIGEAYCHGTTLEYERQVLAKIAEGHKKSIWSS